METKLNDPELSSEPALSTWVDNHLTRLGQSAIRLQDRIVVYFDHPEVLRKLSKVGTHVIVPESMREKKQDAGLATVGLLPGETKTIGELTVTAIPAYNKTKPMHQRKNGFVGYFVRLPNGIVLYHSDYTDFVPEMVDLKPDVALLPFSSLGAKKFLAFGGQRVKEHPLAAPKTTPPHATDNY